MLPWSCVCPRCGYGVLEITIVLCASAVNDGAKTMWSNESSHTMMSHSALDTAQQSVRVSQQVQSEAHQITKSDETESPYYRSQWESFDSDIASSGSFILKAAANTESMCCYFSFYVQMSTIQCNVYGVDSSGLMNVSSYREKRVKLYLWTI